MTRKSPCFGTPEERLRSFLVRDEATGCLIFTGAKARRGYGKLRIGDRTVSAHVLAWDLWVDTPRNGLLIRHSCDTPPCCEPSHLLLGTHAMNSADMVARGRSTRGEGVWSASLTADDIRAIRTSTDSSRLVSAQYGISDSTVRKIRRRERWSHVE